MSDSNDITAIITTGEPVIDAIVTTEEPAVAATLDDLRYLVFNGKKGDSAYDEAVKLGFVGTEAEWIASLKGEKGDDYVLTVDDKDEIARETASLFDASVEDEVLEIKGAFGAGLSAADAAPLQVPVADGQGGWQWGDQIGSDAQLIVSETITEDKTIRASADGADITRLVLHGKTVGQAEGKNLCSLGSASWTGVKDFAVEPIPAGDYMFSGVLSVDGTGDTSFCVGFYGESGQNLTTKATPQSAPGQRVSFHITLSAPCVSLRLYAGGGWGSAQGKNGVWTDVQIEAGSSATAYEPYGAAGPVGIAPRVSLGGVVLSAPSVEQLVSGDTLDLLTGAYYDSVNDTTQSVAVTGSVAGLAGELALVTQGAVDITYTTTKIAYAENILSLVYARIGAENRVTLHAADEYPLVAGDTFELFWRGVLGCRDPYRYYTEAVCDRGKAFVRRFIYTPTAADVGTRTLKLSVYDDNRVPLASQDVSLKVLAKPSNPASVKNVLYIGDSLASNGVVATELHRRLTGNGGTPEGDGLSNINFIGTCEASDGTRFEGYGGWSYQSYLTENRTSEFMWITAAGHGKTAGDQHSVYADANSVRWKLETIEADRIKLVRVSASGALPASGTLTWVSGGADTGAITYTASEQAAGNPFWNPSTNEVDFSWYAQQQGVSSIDYVFILLGWNNWKSDAAEKEDRLSLINKLRSAFPNCKVCLLGIQIPSADGAANNYGASGTWNVYGMTQRVWQIDRVNAETAAELDGVYWCNVSGQFDSEYNMPTDTRTVNARSSQTESYGSNGVHPAARGYLQIADAAYRAMVKMLEVDEA